MKKKVLCIERSSSLSFILRTVLRKSFDVQVVSNALMAIGRLQKSGDIECVILSIEKGNFRNIALLQHIKTSSFLKDIPIIVLTDVYDDELKKLCKLYGVLEVFEKPFDPLKLLDTMEEYFFPTSDSEIIFKKRKILNLN